MTSSFEKLLPVKEDSEDLRQILTNMRSNKVFMELAAEYGSLRSLVVTDMVAKLHLKQSITEAAHALSMQDGVTLVPNGIMMYASHSE